MTAYMTRMLTMTTAMAMIMCARGYFSFSAAELPPQSSEQKFARVFSSQDHNSQGDDDGLHDKDADDDDGNDNDHMRKRLY